MKELFEYHPLIEKLEQLVEVKNIQVVSANFITEEVVVTFVEPCESFGDVIQRLKFCEMSKRLVIQRADFTTGNIAVKILDHDKDYDLTDEEIQFLKNNMLIKAIRSVRARRGLGLADAKKMVVAARERLKAQGSL
jgi:hypothetical protein